MRMYACRRSNARIPRMQAKCCLPLHHLRNTNPPGTQQSQARMQQSAAGSTWFRRNLGSICNKRQA